MKALLAAACLALAGLPAAAGPTDILLEPVTVSETKALFGRIESRFVVPARSRIGGTLTTLAVTEGSLVAAGQVIARVDDAKLATQLAAAEARIGTAGSQLQNAESELARSSELLARGATTVQRVDQLRTAVEVARNALAEARAARQVVAQQVAEGEVIAPAAGRILTVPVRPGAVILPGEAIATIAGGGVFLRLAIPERHAEGLAAGTTIAVADGTGTIEKVYPLIEGGRVTADVAVDGLSDTFIGQRVQVAVPVAQRPVLAVPPAAISTRSGLDIVRLRDGAEVREVTVVPGRTVAGPDGPLVEVLTGLVAGDTVILP